MIYPSDAKLGYCIKNFVCETREKSLRIQMRSIFSNVVATVTVNDLIFSPLDGLIELVKTTYMVQLSQGCGALGTTNYTLVTRQFGGTGPCRGDSASVVDLASRTNAGFCMIQQIVPYSGPS